MPTWLYLFSVLFMMPCSSQNPLEILCICVHILNCVTHCSELLQTNKAPLICTTGAYCIYIVMLLASPYMLTICHSKLHSWTYVHNNCQQDSGLWGSPPPWRRHLQHNFCHTLNYFHILLSGEFSGWFGTWQFWINLGWYFKNHLAAFPIV